MSSPAEHPWARRERLGEERIALASVLQELTVAALDLFDPERSADAFLERVAERLGGYAALVVESTPEGTGRLMGASGIGAASRDAPIPPSVVAALLAGAELPKLPYPELEIRPLSCWRFPILAGDHAPAWLLLYFHRAPEHRGVPLPPQYHGMVARLARILGDVLSHRALFARTRASERHLDEKKTMLEHIGEASNTGVVVLDDRERLLFWNHVFTRMWSLDELVLGGSWLDVRRTLAARMADPDAFARRADELAANPDVPACDELQLADGRVVERHVAPVRSRGGVRYGRALYFADITARKQAEIERERLLETERAARASAEQAIRIRDEFLSIASHELRTPLTSLQLVVQSLRAAHARGVAIPSETVTPLLESVERQTRRLTRLTSELLDVSRLAAGELHLTCEPVELVAICKDVVARHRDELARAGSSATVHASGPITGVWDASRIDQLVSNLLSNAIKYGEGRPIELTVRGDEHDATLAVRDEGLGIEHEQLARLFDRFARGVSARHYGGLGLGLYVVQQIVGAHGGRVSVTSVLGAGSTFTVVLPRAGPPGLVQRRA